MSVHSLPSTDAEHANDPLWAAICAEVRDVINEEPMLEDFLTATILDQTSLESALSAHLGNQIDCATVQLACFATSFQRPLQHEMTFGRPCAMTSKPLWKETQPARHCIFHFSISRDSKHFSCIVSPTGCGIKIDNRWRFLCRAEHQ